MAESLETPVIRAVYELAPEGAAEALLTELSTGMHGGPDFVRGTVLEAGSRTVLELPAACWGADVAMLLSSVVLGGGMEARSFERCRLVDLELPVGLLPGPAFAAPDRALVGCTVKPSLGLGPSEVAEVASAIVRGGADLVRDHELLGDPEWCPFEERVQAVMAVVPREVVYCPNVTGPVGSLLYRAERAVELGATGLAVNAFAQGLDAVRLLRDADLGVPILVHRVGAGAIARNDRFGVAGHVLALLTRLCGADGVQVGAFGGTRFDADEDVRASVDACHRALEGVPASVAVLSGGIAPGDAVAQAEAAGGDGVLVLLGSAAYAHPGGVEEGVRAAAASLSPDQ